MVSGFTGEHEHSLDAKGRLILPAKFRGRLERLVITKARDRCLHVYPPDEFERVSAELASAGSKARRLTRWFFSGAHEGELDSQGRIGIPETLRRYAGLERDVTVIGNGPHVEIWDRQTWAAQAGQLEEELSQSEEFGDLPI